MHDDNPLGLWALMFWRFHGIGENDAVGFIGSMLAAHYDETARDLPLELTNLVAQLEAAEQHGQADAQ